MGADRFNAFNATDITYKTVNSTHLGLTILIPKHIKSGKCPLLVHFHGGGLIVGDKMFPDWFALWLLQFAEKQGAIIVTPNYRLVPEAKGIEILDDINDFWGWVHDGSLASAVSSINPDVEVNLSRIVAGGESAGGYLSLQSALLFPSSNIKAVISQYGVMDFAHPVYQKLMSAKAPVEESKVDKYIASIKPDTVKTFTPMPEGLEMMVTVIKEGRQFELIGSEEELMVTKSLERAGKVPPIWFLHGGEDEIVSPETSIDFHKKLRELHPDTPSLLSMREGAHGFDSEMGMDEEWIQKGCEFVKRFW